MKRVALRLRVWQKYRRMSVRRPKTTVRRVKKRKDGSDFEA
jgi:hypothetical protein